jgi:hypothetical protein
MVHGLAGKFVKIGTVRFFPPQLDVPSFGFGFIMNRDSAGTVSFSGGMVFAA